MEAVIEKMEKTMKTIMVIEDNEDLNELVCLVLKDSGFKALSAKTGEESLKVMRETRPDLILLDYVLPDIEGADLFRYISADKELTGIPVIIVSARGDMHTKMSSYLAGARRYITKPFDSDELVAEIKRTFEQIERTKKISSYKETHQVAGDFGVMPADFEKENP